MVFMAKKKTTTIGTLDLTSYSMLQFWLWQDWFDRLWQVMMVLSILGVHIHGWWSIMLSTYIGRHQHQKS